MGKLRLSLKVPAVLLGVPVPQSENPYIGMPISSMIVGIELRSSKDPSLELLGEPPRAPLIRGVLDDFWRRLCKGMEMSYIARISIENVIGSPGPSGVYAALTVALLHSLAKEHGEVLDEYEIAEMGRLSDPFNEGPPWSGIIDALRFSVSYGTTVAYRNEEEVAKFDTEGLKLRYEGFLPVRGPRITREGVGGEIYNALVKLSGLMTLEGAIMIREGKGLEEVLNRLTPLQEAITLGVWGLSPRRGRFLAPGLPRNFEYYKAEA